ncbi:MAG: hypothetical protein KBA33_00070 [Cloacibacterium sp.]|nr:hypothetical protein [Cloacibacterium sp.]
MNTRKLLAIVSLGLASLGFAQEKPSELIKADLLKNVDINLLLRSAFEAPHTSTEPTSATAMQNALRVNEARLEIRGRVVENLEFRVRTRLHKANPERTLDKSTNNLDFAYAAYKFGNKKQWEAVVGKQNNYLGSWEFEKNPTFEYQYSDVVVGYTNIFGMGARLHYTVNPNHMLTVQAYNTNNDNFATVTGATTPSKFMNGKEEIIRSKMPMGFQLAWQGNFFDKKFRTWYSVGTSEFAQDKRNYQVALGNKYITGKFEGYLDLLYTNLAFDHTSIFGLRGAYSKYYNAANGTSGTVFAQDINLKSAVLRMDYQVAPKWTVTTKGFYETATSNNDDKLRTFRTNLGYMVGLEFHPVAKQNFKLFTYFYGNNIKYNNISGAANVNNNVFSIGALYFVNVL